MERGSLLILATTPDAFSGEPQVAYLYAYPAQVGSSLTLNTISHGISLEGSIHTEHGELCHLGLGLAPFCLTVVS